MDSTTGRRREQIAIVQGMYWAVTGLWPILHLRSFEAVTGKKKEGWLVQTFGSLIAVVGATLLLAGRRTRVTREVAVLGAGGALALGAADTLFAARRRISPVYLADAVLEAAIAAAWLGATAAHRTSRPAPLTLVRG